MSSFVPVSVSYPPLYSRQVLELWDYVWDAQQQSYERVSFRPLHMFERDDNPVDNVEEGEFLPPRPILLRELPSSVQRRMERPPTRPPPPPPSGVPPTRPPPPPPGVPPTRPPPPPGVSVTSPRQVASGTSPRQVASPRPGPILSSPVSPTVAESPASPDSSEPYSPTDTPTKRTTPSPRPHSPDRLECERSFFVARQDHQFALPSSCPNNQPPRPPVPAFSASNPPLQPAPEPHRARVRSRRRAPSPPRPVGRGRGAPYARPSIPSEDSAFGRPSLPFGRARSLFSDFIPNIQSPPSPPPMAQTFPGPSRTPSPPLPGPSRSPSPDLLMELYQHSRHPEDNRSHLTITPSWSRKAPKEDRGECIICYGEDEHLQIQCQNCQTMKVCCVCVVGVYQSINPCPVCRFRGEY